MYSSMSGWLSSLHNLFFIAAACLIGAAADSAHAGPLRVLTLTPHATEMVYAAGGASQIVATVQSSNYPVDAGLLPRLGDGLNTSLEQVLAWRPDLIVGWPSPLMQRLQSLGKSVFVTSPQSIEDIIQDIASLARILETEDLAREVLDALGSQARQLELAGLELRDNTTSTSAARKPVRIVVMAGVNDEYVIGRDKLINQAIERCGAINPFAGSLLLAPRVSLESIISGRPDLIVTGYPPSKQIASLAKVIVMDPDILYRPGPRFIQASQEICDALARIRSEPISKSKSKD